MSLEQNDHLPPAAASSEPGAGDLVKDFLPIPDTTSFDEHQTANSLAEAQTLSHSLAVGEQETKGAAQQGHEAEDVADLGWNEKQDAIPAPLLGGMDNSELWVLIRRFNKASRRKAVLLRVAAPLD